jgi:hypothetical protein
MKRLRVNTSPSMYHIPRPFNQARIFPWGTLPTFCSQFEWWYEVALFSAYCLAYSNSVINPILYGGLNPSFKRAFINTLLAALRTGAAGQDRDLLARFGKASSWCLISNSATTWRLKRSYVSRIRVCGDTYGGLREVAILAVLFSEGSPDWGSFLKFGAVDDHLVTSFDSEIFEFSLRKFFLIRNISACVVTRLNLWRMTLVFEEF